MATFRPKYIILDCHGRLIGGGGMRSLRQSNKGAEDAATASAALKWRVHLF
jgi:hypothetical protein